MRRVLAVMAVLMVACGTDAQEATEQAAQETTTTRPNTVQEEAWRSAATAPTTTRLTTTTTTRPTEYAMGATLTVSPGDHKVTVYAYKAPVTSGNRFTQPKDGFAFGAIDVQQCAGPSGDRFGPNRFDWELAMPDNTRLRAGTTVSEPQLASSPLGPGDCIRGWVSFEVPAGKTPAHVVYTQVNSGTAKWRVT